MRRDRAARRVGIGLAAIAVLLLIIVLVFTQTNWGREQVRQVALEWLADMVEGEVEIGRVEGNLLSRVRLLNVSIRDREGRPFVVADTLETQFGLRALMRQRLELHDLRIVGAHLVLDKPPGEEWNYLRIFDTGESDTGPGPAGWGDWVVLEDVTLVDTRITVRDEWRPPSDLTPEERAAALRNALAGDARENVVAVPGGYQNVMEFREIDARLPDAVIAHPYTMGVAFEVATLSGLVRPFTPPPARVHDFAGEFRVMNDSLFMSGVRAELDDSRLVGGGTYALHSGDLLLLAHAAPVAFADLQWIYPPLPGEGGGSMFMRLELGSVADRIVLQDMDVTIGDAVVAGQVDVTTGDTIRFGETDLRFARVGTGLLERLVDIELPRPGELTGELALLGPPGDLRLDGDVRFDDAAGPSSRIVAAGRLAVEPDLRFRELRLGLRPLDASLARAVVPGLPLSGTIEGVAVLTGVPSNLDLEADLALRDPRHGLSQVRVAGGLDTRGDMRFRQLAVQMDPLRLDLLRDELPELPAGASATGRIVIDGPVTGWMRVAGDLVLQDPATGVSGIGATGELALADGVSFRELDLRFDPLQAELARSFIPDIPARGTINGTATVTGTPASLDLAADLTLRDPRHGVSHLVANGGLEAGDVVRLRSMVVRMDPLRLDLLREWVPEVPAGAAATGRVALDGAPSSDLHVDGDFRLDDPQTGVSQIAATGTLGLGDPLTFDGLRVRMDPLRMDLLRGWLPGAPPGGSLTGELRLDGSPSGLVFVDGEVAHEHPELGGSRVEVSGGIDLAGSLAFRNLDLVLEPLNMALVRAFAPDLPLDGTLAGTARLNGSPTSAIAMSGDVVHVEGLERSRVAGQVDIQRGPGGWASVDVSLQPLSLDVAGRFLPAAGLHGSVAGRLRAAGNMRDVRVDADLTAGDGGRIIADGTLNLAGAEPVYDLDTRLRDFDLAAVTWRAPAETDLTGTVSARGRGLDPATMRATIAADLVGSEVGDVDADVVRLRLAMEAGLARVDSSIVRLDGAEATLDGSFGLVAGREGVLTYEVTVDSLHAFAAWVPGADRDVAPIARPVVPPVDTTTTDTTTSDPPATLLSELTLPAELGMTRPAQTRRYIAGDGARVTEMTTLVQAGIDRPDEDPDRARLEAIARDAAEARAIDLRTANAIAGGTVDDSIAPTPAPRPLQAPTDSLSGSLDAAGTLRGNVAHFDTEGRAVLDDLLYQGAFIGEGAITYDLADVGTAAPAVRLDAALHDVRAGGAALDSLTARGGYRGLLGDGAGEAVIVAHGTDDTEYRADAAFSLSPARSELRIADLSLRLDTITWRMEGPGMVSWADDAIEVASIDLTSSAGGRILLDGRLPEDGSGDMDLVVHDLEIAQFVTLLQLDQDAEGLLNIEANARGTLAAPRVTGSIALDDGRLDDGEVPDVRATFEYADRRLTAGGAMYDGSRRLASLDASLPIDLALVPAFAPRLLPGELAVDVQADSLPLEAIPTISEQVTDARGRVRGQVAIRGTSENPIVTGDVDLDLGSVRLVPLGLRLEDVVGRVVLDGERLVVDSLVARSGGELRIAGEIGVADMLDPSFDLEITSRETLVIDTRDATLEVDADLTVGGTLDAISVRGDIRTRKGVIYIPRLAALGETRVVSLHAPPGSERLETAFLERLRLPERQSPFLQRLQLDISVQIDRDVWLRSTEANVEIYTPRDVGPLRIRMDPAGQGLALEGAINTDRGEYEFMSRRFDLTRGAATFQGDPGINPVLQIAAAHEVRLPGREPFDIRIVLGGTVRDLEITLESNSQPPIAQTDLLAYLAFGSNATSLLYRQGSPLSAQGGEAGELVGNVAGLATQQLGTIALDAVLNEIEDDLMRELNVDVFRITPADLPPDMFSGGYTDLLRSTEVEGGKYLTSRLFVAGQLSMGASRPGVRVEYRAPFGLEWVSTWRSRWLPNVPTLEEQDPRSTAVLGSFLIREWRF